MAEKAKSRYGDAELQEFKDIINSKLKEAREDAELLKNHLATKMIMVQTTQVVHST